MTFRKTIFWLHLAAGLIAGLVIGMMSLTGAALAYEKELIAWSERDAQRVSSSPGVQPLAIEELLARVRAAKPEAQPANIVIKDDPEAAVAVGLGRAGTVYVDPYQGDVRTPEPTALRSFMATMVSWHRYIALSGDNRALGKAITGACNAAFLVLGLTGLYLWWPRSWSTRALKSIATMRFNLSGKARDFNWHNSLGLWFALPIIVLTATALPISYTWAGTLIARLNPPGAAPGGGPGAAAQAVTLTALAPGTPRLGYDALLASVREQVPGWKQITINLGGAPTGPGPGGPAATPVAGNALQPVTFTVRESGSWPRTANTTLVVDPYTGTTLRRDEFSAMPLGNQVRGWTRFLHTGEALGPVGQGVAGIACLAAVILMWTGFALSWRRFFGRTRSAPSRA